MLEIAPSQRTGHFFDGWLTIERKSVLNAYAEFLFIVLGNEVARQRKRRQKDQEDFEGLVRSVVANLAYPIIVGSPSSSVFVILAKASGKAMERYPHCPGFRCLPTLLGQLAGRDLIGIHKSRTVGLASRIQAHESLVRFIADRKLTRDALSLIPGRQTIILRSVEKNHRTGKRTYTLFDYPETAETVDMRREMTIINERLAGAMLQTLRPLPGIDLRDRQMVRAFKTDESGEVRFDRVGRIWGGFWQNLEKDLKPLLRINSGRIADLDFVSMYLRLTYLRAGLRPPDGDLYADIISNSIDGSHRAGVKLCVNAMLSIDKPLRRLPRAAAGLLPLGSNYKTIRAAILLRHAPIAHLFETGVGDFLAKMESDILIDILMSLDNEDIISLPMHDGLIINRAYASRAQEIMGDASERKTGFRLPVKRTDL